VEAVSDIQDATDSHQLVIYGLVYDCCLDTIHYNVRLGMYVVRFQLTESDAELNQIVLGLLLSAA